jgi:hypothetical protein
MRERLPLRRGELLWALETGLWVTFQYTVPQWLKPHAQFWVFAAPFGFAQGRLKSSPFATASNLNHCQDPRATAGLLK